MKLKDTYQSHKTLFNLGGVGFVLIVGILAWAWFGASSSISVPKAEQHEANANVEQQKSITAETQANDIRDQKVVAHRDTVQSKSTLNERKAQYEKVRKGALSNGVSNANLDTRERQLQSDLERLYPVNR